MPGSFTKDARPVRPGAYFNWESEPTETILPGIGSVMCLPIVHDWGPSGVLVPTLSLQDFTSKFGPSTDTPGYLAAKGAFKGEGTGGRAGAGEILFYRMVGETAAAGTLDLLSDGDGNGGATALITLTALYDGTYSDNLGAKVTQSLSDPSKIQVQITLNGTVIETHSAIPGDIDSLITSINGASKWVSAEKVDDGTLDTGQGLQTFSGGDDGETLTNDDWTSMLGAVSNAAFSLFAPFDVTDQSLLQAIREWQSGLNSSGKRFMTVVGGDIDDTAVTAIARSTMLAGMDADEDAGGGENVVNLGAGTLIDDDFGELSTSQLAPRIAGILAARGETMSLTFARLQGTSAGQMPSDADIAQCFDGGVVCFGQDSNADAPIRVEKGLTCYTGGDDAKPYLIYRNPKFVRTMHGIELDITSWATTAAIGTLQVNDQTRALVVGYGHTVMDARAGQGVIQDGYTVGIDPIPPPSDDDEFIAVVYGIAFGRSVEQIFNTVYIS